jgi:hypothetical protein
MGTPWKENKWKNGTFRVNTKINKKGAFFGRLRRYKYMPIVPVDGDFSVAVGRITFLDFPQNRTDELVFPRSFKRPERMRAVRHVGFQFPVAFGAAEGSFS